MAGKSRTASHSPYSPETRQQLAPFEAIAEFGRPGDLDQVAMEMESRQFAKERQKRSKGLTGRVYYNGQATPTKSRGVKNGNRQVAALARLFGWASRRLLLGQVSCHVGLSKPPKGLEHRLTRVPTTRVASYSQASAILGTERSIALVDLRPTRPAAKTSARLSNIPGLPGRTSAKSALEPCHSVLPGHNKLES